MQRVASWPLNCDLFNGDIIAGPIILIDKQFCYVSIYSTRYVHENRLIYQAKVNGIVHSDIIQDYLLCWDISREYGKKSNRNGRLIK
jgi:hypothetical protein